MNACINATDKATLDTSLSLFSKLSQGFFKLFLKILLAKCRNVNISVASDVLNKHKILFFIRPYIYAIWLDICKLYIPNGERKMAAIRKQKLLGHRSVL